MPLSEHSAHTMPDRLVLSFLEQNLRNSLKLIEQKKVNAELRNRQTLAGEKATLVCWMEVV